MESTSVMVGRFVRSVSFYDSRTMIDRGASTVIPIVAEFGTAFGLAHRGVDDPRAPSSEAHSSRIGF